MTGRTHQARLEHEVGKIHEFRGGAGEQLHALQLRLVELRNVSLRNVVRTGE
jgi:hypothetical protein